MPRFNAFIQTILLLSVVFSLDIRANDNIGNVIELSEAQLNRYKEKNLNILGVIKLQQETSSGALLSEYSGLAWDEDEQLLHALSDRAHIISLKPTFLEKHIKSVELVNYIRLKNELGKHLKGIKADSEGLLLEKNDNRIKADTEFIISFERQPRIERYSIQGDLIKSEEINPDLNIVSNYQGENKSLEAITKHEKYGYIYGPEKQLINTNDNELHIYNSQNKNWSFTPHSSTSGALVGLTTLPNNQLIALERIFTNIISGVSTAIHLLNITDETIQHRELSYITPTDGYINENFEGITWHEGNRFFMISDDNNNVFQKTLLIYFEIINLDN